MSGSAGGRCAQLWERSHPSHSFATRLEWWETVGLRTTWPDSPPPSNPQALSRAGCKNPRVQAAAMGPKTLWVESSVEEAIYSLPSLAFPLGGAQAWRGGRRTSCRDYGGGRPRSANPGGSLLDGNPSPIQPPRPPFLLGRPSTQREYTRAHPNELCSGSSQLDLSPCCPGWPRNWTSVMKWDSVYQEKDAQHPSHRFIVWRPW